MFCIIVPRNDCIILNCETDDCIILAWPKFRPINTRYQNLDRVWLLEYNNSWCINNKKHCDHQRKNTRAMIQHANMKSRRSILDQNMKSTCTLIDMILTFKCTDFFTLCQKERCISLLITHCDKAWYILE